jgi:uncharacterized membrane protein YeiH
LLNRRTLFWVDHQDYPVIVFVLSLMFVYIPWIFVPAQPLVKRLFNLVDALGLALFSISGTSYALAYQMPYFVASLIGVITGVFGGVLRDILLNEIPLIFRTQTSLYATCSFVGCWVFLVSLLIGINTTSASFLGFASIVIFRMISIQYGITLPFPRYLKAEQQQDDQSQVHKKRQP